MGYRYYISIVIVNMPPNIGGRNQTPSKPPDSSSMTHKESEHMSFRVSQLEGLVKGFVLGKINSLGLEGYINL